MTKTLKFGPFSVREHKETGQWMLNIPEKFSPTGKRYRPLCETKSEAVGIARELHKRFRFRELGYAEPKPQAKKSLNESVNDWECAQKVRIDAGKLQIASLITRLNQLSPVRDFLGDQDIARITSELMEHYQAWRRRHSTRPATINSEIASLRQVLLWEQGRSSLKFVPKVDTVESDDREWDIPSDAETAALIEHLPEKLKTVTRLLAETGVRAGEAYNLPWKHINLAEGYFDVKPFRSWRPKGKNKVSWRRIWISSGLRDEMQRLPKDGVYVFSSRDPDKPTSSIRKQLMKAAKKTGLMRDNRSLHFTPATFRKTFATHQAMSGVPVSVLKKQMGHSKDSRMLDKFYIHVQEEAVQAACRELPIPSKQTLAISGNDADRRGQNAA